MLYNLHGRKSSAESGTSNQSPKNFTSYEDRHRTGSRSNQSPRERHLERSIAVSSTVSYQVEDEEGIIQRSFEKGELSFVSASRFRAVRSRLPTPVGAVRSKPSNPRGCGGQA